jgi:putative redox protein
MRALSRAGIGVLRFDFAGTGIGGGTGEPVNFASDVEDLRAAANAMAAAGMAPSLLVGHSLGGTAAIVAAADMPDIAAVATIGAPADLQHILRLFGPNDLDTIASEGEASVEIAGRPFLIRRGFLEAVEGIDVEKPLPPATAGAGHALSAGSGGRHRPRVAHLRRVQAPKSFISLDNADHLLTDVADANYAAAMVAVWASRFLPPLSADLPQVEVAEGVVSTETLAGTFQLKVRSGEHTLFADEPASVGGLGTGLSPYELVSAGLAACTVMTMRLYEPQGLSARTGEHDRAAREGAGHDATRPVHPHHCPRWAEVISALGSSRSRSVSRRSESHPGFGRADRALERQSGCGSARLA